MTEILEFPHLAWNPGLDNDGLTLKEVLDTLPGYEPKAIHFLVRLFENPSSPVAFTGAISLKRHDAVHIMLGRGLMPQDEAFVIGFTMGTSKTISRLEVRIYEKISKYLYPKEYKFTDEHIKIYQLGLEYGRSSAVSHIYEFPFEHYFERRIGDVRKVLGIDTEALRSIYRQEHALFPETEASLRLPV